MLVHSCVRTGSKFGRGDDCSNTWVRDVRRLDLDLQCLSHNVDVCACFAYREVHIRVACSGYKSDRRLSIALALDGWNREFGAFRLGLRVAFRVFSDCLNTLADHM